MFHNLDKPKTSDGKPLENELLDEKYGLILPFDDLAEVPPIHIEYDEITTMNLDNSVQDALDDLQKTVPAKYNQPDLEAKAWPKLLPHRCGSWNGQSTVHLAECQKS